MRTRSSSNLVGNSSSNPTTSNPKRRNRRRSNQRVEPFALEEALVVTMADQCTMAELLRAPTEGYAEAIVVPPILALIANLVIERLVPREYLVFLNAKALGSKSVNILNNVKIPKLLCYTQVSWNLLFHDWEYDLKECEGMRCCTTRVFVEYSYTCLRTISTSENDSSYKYLYEFDESHEALHIFRDIFENIIRAF
ncbi:hypothetical protein Tco_0149785 [Tanacetum coccineum]